MLSFVQFKDLDLTFQQAYRTNAELLGEMLICANHEKIAEKSDCSW